MRILFMGGTKAVGPAAVRHLDRHDVAVAHTGAHEHPEVAHVEHLHGERDVPGGAPTRHRDYGTTTAAPSSRPARRSSSASCARSSG